MSDILMQQLDSADPSIRYKVRTQIQGEAPDTTDSLRLQEAIRTSPRVEALLAERDADGRIPHHPYAKWGGAHWVLATLAELDYPPGDTTLVPLREQVYAWLLSPHRIRRFERSPRPVRICASQEGNAIFALLKLGLADDRVVVLVERLLATRWPDGGWNCDRNASGNTSSFMETLLPLRALAHNADHSGSTAARNAAEQAAEIFLRRRLFKRQRDDTIIARDFVRLHYPCFWHYDILFGLKVMDEAGFLDDPRCADALDLLESKRLPDGGFPAEGSYYRWTDQAGARGRSLVDWGGVSRLRSNAWVTTDALAVLKAAGRSAVDGTSSLQGEGR